MGLTTAKAIRQFLATPPHACPVTASELVEFKKACSPEEWEQFGKDSCAAMGVEWEAPPA